MNIAGSILIITGASSGIGAATARELARRGATVVLAARRVEELNRIANDLTHLGHKVLAVPTDVGSRESIDHLVAHTVEAYGRVDGVVNVAGIGGAGIIEHASDEVLEQMVTINLLAPARLIQAALPFMKHDGSAAIVNIGSIAGEMGTNGMYSATKFGLRGLSDSLRRELWTKHIGVSLGDGVGGNLATVTTLLAKERGGPPIAFQVLLYPVTDGNFETPSYRAFGAEGYWLTREMMRWFWDSYAPAPERKEFTVSPLQASLEQLRGLPPALIMTNENDVVRDEGEAYAHKLMAAGVPVIATRYLGSIHDLALLNPIAGTPPVRAALAQVNDTLRTVFAHKAPEERDTRRP